MTTSSKKQRAATRHHDDSRQRQPDVEALLHRLRRTSSKALLEVVEEHGRDFTIRELRQALLNPYIDGEVLQALAANRKLTATREAKAAIARHRSTPEPVAMRLIPHLSWRELNEITLDPRIRAPVRRVAQRYLVQRLPRLSQGEKINLARRSIDTVAAHLVAEAQPRVLDAGLENARLSERALLTVVTSPQAPPRLLDRIANHPRWGARYEVRAALAQNSSTPYRVILRHLEILQSEVLERIAANTAHAGFLRSMARQLIDSRARAATIRLESLALENPETITDPDQGIDPRLYLDGE